MTNSKRDFQEVLIEAKKLGYAETNPSSDLNGEDVKSKIQILSSLAFNSFINGSNINVEGIKNIDQEDIKNANILGYKIKHLGIAEIKNNKIIQRVHPCFIKKKSYITNVDGVLNAVIIEGNPIGKFILQGEGAGSGPTTSALISDMCSVLRGNIKFPFSIPNKNRKKISTIDISKEMFSYYLRFDVLDQKGVLSSITRILSKNNISVKRMIQNPLNKKQNASIVIISHKSKNQNLIKSLKELSNKPFMVKKPKFIRIEKI